jgi:transcriptional regulator with XRE-family HTH domain
MNLIRLQQNLETLGQRLKTIRKQRGMTPLKLAAAMDSSLTSIRDWENGERKLQPATIRRLAEALQLSYPEEMYCLGLAGHIPHTRMPAKEQIISALSAYYEDLKELPYPAQIIDHHFTYWLVNPATIDFIGSYDALAALMQHKLTALDVIFNTQMGFFNRVARPNELTNRQHQLARRIMGRSLHRRHEDFYQNYPDWLQNRLPEDDFNTFLEVWDDVNSIHDVEEQNPRLKDDIMLRYFEFEYPNGEIRRLQMRTDHLRHFGDIFEIIIYYPFNQETDEQFKPQSSQGVKLWDVMDVGKLLLEY